MNPASTIPTAEAPALQRLAGALALAASPCCAVMAWVSAQDGGAVCSAAPQLLPLDGMAMMYLLMALLHLPPWLRLASRGRRPRVEPSTPGEHHEPPHRLT